METVYTIKGKNTSVYWMFKYDLKGVLRSFEMPEGELSQNQILWLFSHRFPATEMRMKAWIAEYKKNFDITIGVPDLSFEFFWKTYKNPVKKVMTQRSWDRLSQSDRRSAIAHIKIYDNYLRRKGIAKAHPSTYLNQRYWEDNHGQIA